MKIINSLNHPIISVKQNWNDSWQELETASCNRIYAAIAPSFSTCQFTLHYGQIKQPTNCDYEKVLPTLHNHLNGFVQVTTGHKKPADRINLFTGVITNVTDKPIAQGVCDKGTGDQIASAIGMEQLLLTNITGSHIETGYSTNGFIETILTFNTGDSIAGVVGNRSSSKQTLPNGRSCYVFSDSKTHACTWSAYDAIEYLLAAFSPTQPAFGINQNGAANNLKNQIEVFNPADSVFGTLANIIDKRKGHAFFITENANIEIRSVLVSQVTAGSVNLAANDLQRDIDFKDIDSLGEFEIRKSADAQFGKLIVTGEPILVCGTVSSKANTLEKLWNNEAEYQAATKEQRRTSQFDNTFSGFKLSSNVSALFNKTDTTTQGAPVIKADGTLDLAQNATFYSKGKVLEDFIPIKNKDTDPDYLEPQVYAKLTEDNLKLYSPVTTMGQAWKEYGVSSATIRRLKNELGFQLRTSTRHLLAGKTFTLTNEGDGDEPLPVLDYRDLNATLAIRLDQKLKVETVLNANLQREKVLNVPGAEFWCVLPGTKVGIKKISETENALKDYAGKQVVRNDLEKLELISKLAAVWYKRQRCAVTVTKNRIEPFTDGFLGDMIKTVKYENATRQVNAIITAVTLDFTRQITTWQTDFSELDFVTIVNKNRNSRATSRSGSHYANAQQIASVDKFEPFLAKLTDENDKEDRQYSWEEILPDGMTGYTPRKGKFNAIEIENAKGLTKDQTKPVVILQPMNGRYVFSLKKSIKLAKVTEVNYTAGATPEIIVKAKLCSKTGTVATGAKEIKLYPKLDKAAKILRIDVAVDDIIAFLPTSSSDESTLTGLLLTTKYTPEIDDYATRLKLVKGEPDFTQQWTQNQNCEAVELEFLVDSQLTLSSGATSSSNGSSSVGSSSTSSSTATIKIVHTTKTRRLIANEFGQLITISPPIEKIETKTATLYNSSTGSAGSYGV